MTDSPISCQEALRLLAAWLDRELGEEEVSVMAGHLETCRSCYSRAEFEKALKAQVAQLGRAPVEPALEVRVRDLLQHFRGGAV
jgi:anti-sigma factor (TIGR02949 family)